VFIEADRLSGLTKKKPLRRRRAVRRHGQSFFADHMRLETASQELEASGNVRLDNRVMCSG